MSERIPTCVWRISGDLIRALDEALGPPVDSYLNGAQTWLRDNGPSGMVLEWRLHPVAGYVLAEGASHYDVWDAAAAAAVQGDDVVPLGDERRGLADMWDGLEAFPAYDDETEPTLLANACTDALGVAPEASGLVDHDVIADAWERARGNMSITDALFEQLSD